MIERAAKYLVGKPRAVIRYPWAIRSEKLNGYADSDWAGDKLKAKSTSGGAIEWGGHILKTWSSTQSTVALSSGEAELYALTKAAAQCLGMLAILKDFGVITDATLHSDSTAAIAIVHRQGLGRTRHIKVQFLWLQEKIKHGELLVDKIGTEKNKADLMTKHLSI